MPNRLEAYISTREAATIMGLTDSRIRQMIRAGLLKAETIGSRYVVCRRDLKAIERNGGPGRPRTGARS